jgi:hypothetical protein
MKVTGSSAHSTAQASLSLEDLKGFFAWYRTRFLFLNRLKTLSMWTLFYCHNYNL